MTDFNTLVYKLGSLHSMLRELESAGLYQGEHTIHYTGPDGSRHTLHIYIDGTELEMSRTPGGHPGLSFSTGLAAGED
jgi:hypothetical protein